MSLSEELDNLLEENDFTYNYTLVHMILKMCKKANYELTREESLKISALYVCLSKRFNRLWYEKYREIQKSEANNEKDWFKSP